MRVSRLSIGMLAVVLAQAAPAQDWGDDKVDAPPHVWAEVQLAAKSFGSTEASVRALMGKPVSRTVRSKPNRHDPSSTNSIISLGYPGLELEIFEALTGQPHARQFLLTVILKAATKRFRSRFEIGTPKGEVVAAFGAPVSEEAQTLSYHYYDPEILSWAGVAYTFSDGVLASAKRSYDFD